MRTPPPRTSPARLDLARAGEAPDDDPDQLTPEQREAWESLYLRLKRIATIDSSEAYDDMDAFVGTLPDGPARAALHRALAGAKPFRRFKDVLYEWPDLRDAWFAIHGERMRERAVTLLHDLDIEPEEIRGGILPHWLEG